MIFCLKDLLNFEIINQFIFITFQKILKIKSRVAESQPPHEMIKNQISLQINSSSTHTDTTSIYRIHFSSVLFSIVILYLPGKPLKWARPFVSATADSSVVQT